jgi:hypothetical protein
VIGCEHAPLNLEPGTNGFRLGQEAAGDVAVQFLKLIAIHRAIKMAAVGDRRRSSGSTSGTKAAQTSPASNKFSAISQPPDMVHYPHAPNVSKSASRPCELIDLHQRRRAAVVIWKLTNRNGRIPHRPLFVAV